MRCEMNIVAMAKGGQRYVFLYDDQSVDTLLRTFSRFAEDDELNFSKKDVALLTKKVQDSAFHASEFDTLHDG